MLDQESMESMEELAAQIHRSKGMFDSGFYIAANLVEIVLQMREMNAHLSNIADTLNEREQ